MTKLLVRNHVLIVETLDNPAILAGTHRIFLELAVGYQRDQVRQRYTFNDSSAMPEVLIDTIEYFSQNNIAYEMDSNVRSMLHEISTDQDDFERASSLGIALKQHRSKSFRVPNFRRVLTPYQAHSVKHLLGVKHGANFSVPGSGKTTVVYAAYSILLADGIIDKILVIGPRSSFMPWEEEYTHCFGISPRSVRLTGTKPARRIKYNAPEDADLFLTTYQTATRDVSELSAFCRRQKVMVVLDESHNIKKFEGGVWSEAVLSIAKFAARRVILTGTPIPNRYEDLWTQMTFLWPGKQVLGGRQQFAARCSDEEYQGIKSAIRPFFVRTGKAELGLPGQQFDRIDLQMNPYQGNIYRALSHRILSELRLIPEDQAKLREWRRAKMVRLLQTASNPTLLAKRSVEFNIPPLSGEEVSVLRLLENYSQYERPAKFDELIGLVRHITNQGNKIIVWTAFILNIHMLAKELNDLQPLMLYGGIAKDEQENEQLNREQQVRLFREDPNHAILLANPAACAESISLHTNCHHAVYLDRTFDCGRYMQSLDRIHRIGLAPDQETNYYILRCLGTIDETIDRRLEEKQSHMNRLLDDDDLLIGTFESADEHSISATDSDEEADFNATIDDLKHHAAYN